jgi:hypothetical protein
VLAARRLAALNSAIIEDGSRFTGGEVASFCQLAASKVAQIAIVEDQEYSAIRPLIDWLDYNGFLLDLELGAAGSLTVGTKRVCLQSPLLQAIATF